MHIFAHSSELALTKVTVKGLATFMEFINWISANCLINVKLYIYFQATLQEIIIDLKTSKTISGVVPEGNHMRQYGGKLSVLTGHTFTRFGRLLQP